MKEKLRRWIGNLWVRRGWLYMPKWLFVFVYVKPAMESWFKKAAEIASPIKIAGRNRR